MEEKIVTLTNFIPNIRLEDLKECRISRNLKHLCLYSRSGVLSVYVISQNISCIQRRIWQSIDNVKSFAFSDDGSQLLTINEHNILGLYKLQDSSVEQIKTRHFSLLACSFGFDEEDFGNCTKASILFFSKLMTIMFIEDKWLLHFKMDCFQPSDVKKIDIPYCVNMACTRDYVFSLTAGGNISVTSMECGNILLVLNLYSLLKVEQPDHSHRFCKIAVALDGCTVAAVDSLNYIYILDITNLFPSRDTNEHFKESAASTTASVTSFASKVSSMTTVSVFQSSFKGDEEMPFKSTIYDKHKLPSYKAAWNIYLNSLKEEAHHSEDGYRQKTAESSNIQISNVPSDSMCLNEIYISEMGTAVWYTSSAKCFGGTYCLYDTKTGEMISEIEVAEDTFVIPGGFSGHVDGFLSPSKLCMYLGTIKRDVFISKIMQCMDAESVSQLFLEEEWQDLVLPLTALRDGLKQHRTDAAHLAFGFHAQAFRNMWLSNSDKDFISWNHRIEKCEKNMKNLFCEVVAAVEENDNDISFLNHLIHLSLNHANDLLHILHDVMYKNYEEYDSQNKYFAKILVEQIMGHVMNLRKHLKQLRKGNYLQAFKTSPLDYLCEDMKLTWKKWELCKDEDIIYDSVMSNNMPLAQTFLIKARDWPIENVSKEIKRITELWIKTLIKNNEIETTTTIFKNLGYKAKDELREICVKSCDKEIRDNSAEYLFNNNWLQLQEVEAWKFLHTLEAYLEPVEVPSMRKYSQRTSVFKQKRPSLSDIPVTNPELLSIETVLSQQSDWKALVLTELFFNIPGSNLSGLISSQDAWKYLLNNNRDDIVICWIDSFYSGGNPCDDSVKCIEIWFQKMKDLSFDIVENPHLHTPEEIIQIFLSWPINQELIDYVQEANSMQVTKDLVLNHLTRYGVFNSCEKRSPATILSRIGRAKLLHKLVDILNKPTSNLNMELFCELLATYCLKNQLFHLPFVCFENNYLSDNQVRELTGLFSEEKKSGTHWFELWFKYKELLSINFNTDHVYDTILSTIKYLSPIGVDLYLSEHSLLFVALIIFSGVSLKHVYEGGQLKGTEINREMFHSTLHKLPLLEMVLKSSYKQNVSDPDITVYNLLEGCMPFDVSKLFRWQALHVKTEEVMPHFTHEKLVAKYGYKCSLDYIYYLKQGRPSFAVNTFIVEQFRIFKRISSRMIKHACNCAHGVALQNFSDISITSSCISFIGMLGIDTQALRININAAKIILKFLDTSNQDISVAQHKETVALLLHGLAAGNTEATVQILNLLEEALYSSTSNDSDSMNLVESMLQWQVAVKFARLHNLQLPQLYLIDCASRNKWLPFILFVDIYEYPVEQVRNLTNHFKSSSLQEHLFHSLGQMFRFSPDKENIKLLPRDSRKLLYSRIGVAAVDDYQSDSEASLFILPSETAAKVNSIMSAEVVGSKQKKDLFLTLLQCHNSPDPPRALLDTSVLLSNPVLSVLAACYEPSSLLTCFCNWILASLPPASVAGISPKILSALQEQVTSASHVESVLELAVSEKYTSTLSKGFSIFFPDNPLCTFCEFLEASTNKKDFSLSQDKLKQFSTSCLNLKNNSLGAECNYLDGTFFHNSHWITLTSVELIVIALSRCFTSSYYELMFLQVICESNFCEDLPVESPNFKLIGEVIKILSEMHTKPDLQLLCSKDHQQQELNVCIKGLIEERAFDKAIQLAAIGDLPKDDIIMSQLSHEFMKLTSGNGLEEGNMKNLFWDKCHNLFATENTEPLQAAKFFQSHSDKLTNVTDRYYALYYSVKWYKTARYESDNIPNINDENLVEFNMWLSWLQLDINFEKENWQKFSSTLFYTKSDLMKESEISNLEELVCDGVNADQMTLHKLIGSLLDNGDHSTSCRLDKFFKLKNMDLQILLTCMELAEGILTPYELSAEQRLLITSNAHRTYSSGRYRRRTLKSFRSSAMSSVPQSLKSYSLSSEQADTSQNDNHETLNTIEKYSECVKHGKSIANKIVTCYRISLYLEMSYKEVVSIENPMSFLKSTISGDNENKFVVISDLLSAAQISREEVAEFLCEEIVAAISKCQTADHSTIMFWGYDFEANFHLVLELCTDPSLLASKLLSVAKSLGTTQKEAKHQVYFMIVELIIRAHKCYTAACNMEGIATILRKSRLLTSKLLKREEWALMVRLLTGVERYMEMSYIFQILKEHEQFEFLLSKGMDKVWGLKLAVLDFLKTYCPDDKNLFRMVALHFSMYSEVASLWESDAKSLILMVLEMARTEVHSKTSIVFTNNDQTKQILQTAMDNLAHAAQYFIKAKKLNKAMSTAHKAELVALQISLLNFSSSGQTVNCLLELNSQEVANVIIHKLSFPQACIVAQAYGHPTDWGAVLYQHCIINRETTYLAEFTNCMALTATLISDVARRFQMDANITLEMAVEMKKFVACVKSIEVKYRVASQLGFKDILHGMLNGPDVAYLKDTIWKTGYKRQH